MTNLYTSLLPIEEDIGLYLPRECRHREHMWKNYGLVRAIRLIYI